MLPSMLFEQALGAAKLIAKRICDPGSEGYLQRQHLHFSDDASIAARFRQTLDWHVIADAVLDNSKANHGRYIVIIPVGDGAPCISPQVRPVSTSQAPFHPQTTYLEFADAGSVLLLRDDQHAIAHILSAVRTTLGLTGDTICDAMGTEARCQFNGKVLQQWELTERKYSMKLHRDRRNREMVDRIRTVEKVLPRHEATDAYIALQKVTMCLMTGNTKRPRKFFDS